MKIKDMIRQALSVVIVMLSGMQIAYAQSITVRGNVRDDVEPLMGVTVQAKGTTKAVATDLDGNYTISVPDKNAVLVFSYVGYQKQEVKVGDTITHIARPCKEAIAGFEEVKPMVFAGVYPIEAEDFEDLRSSLEKLQLNDASLTFQPESSLALGFGLRCGFLGLLHMEIVQERLDREFDMNVITTVPNVSYNIYDKQGHMTEVHNPGSMPDPTLIDRIEEPYIRASVITTTDYIGPIMTLCLGKRGELVKQEYISGNRVEIYYDMPLGEIVIDFYDKLNRIS